MRKLVGIAALVAAFSPFAHAQSGDAAFAGHPDARNDRSTPVSSQKIVSQKAGKHHVRHAKRHQKKQLSK